jgi:hypothetical protein
MSTLRLRNLDVSIVRTQAYSHAVPPKVGFMSDTSSSPWRTAYVAAIFETEPIKMALRVADARAAITERLNGPIEISRLEHEAIEAARQGLATLKAKPVDAVWSAPT